MISLRAPEQSDVDRLFLWENDPALFESLPYAAPVSRMQVWEYINNYNADPFATRELRLMITDKADGNTVGHIDLFDFDPVNRRAGVAIFIDESFRRQGYAREALELLATYAAHTIGVHQLWANIAIDNEPSKRLFTALGYKPAGKLRSWLRRNGTYTDVLVFQKLFA